MSSIACIAPGVVVFTSGLWNTNSLVVQGIGEQAKAVVVVDPAWYPEEIAEIQSAASGNSLGRATHVLFTHGDYDHVVGWESFPDAQLIAHPKARERDPVYTARRIEALDAANGTSRPRPYRYPPREKFTSPRELDLGGEAMLFFEAPGHQPDCLFTVLPRRRVLIAGDYLSDQEFPFIYFSLSEYRSTLRLTREIRREFAIEKLVPGHGKTAGSPDEIEYRIATDLDYLDRLDAAVEDAKAAGLGVEEAVRRLQHFTFRGRPIVALAKEHADNVRFLYGYPVRE